MAQIYSERICPVCGLIFTPTKPNHKYCADCRQNRPDEVKAYGQKMSYMRKMAIQNQIRSYKPEKDVYEITAEMEAYNKKHHKHLKYGQYVYLMESGRLEK